MKKKKLRYNNKMVYFDLNPDSLTESLDLFFCTYCRKLDSRSLTVTGVIKALLWEYISNPEYYNDLLKKHFEKNHFVIANPKNDFCFPITSVFSNGLKRMMPSDVTVGQLISALFDLYAESPDSFYGIKNGEYTPKYSWLIDGRLEV